MKIFSLVCRSLLYLFKIMVFITIEIILSYMRNELTNGRLVEIVKIYKEWQERSIITVDIFWGLILWQVRERKKLYFLRHATKKIIFRYPEKTRLQVCVSCVIRWENERLFYWWPSSVKSFIGKHSARRRERWNSLSKLISLNSRLKKR